VSGASVAIPARTRRRIRVMRRRFVVFAVLGVALAALYTFWFRDSSLVAVKTVKVEGVGTGTVDKQLEQALTGAGLKMTTLHVDQAALDEAAKAFPLVESVSIDPSFPSTLTVEVTKRVPAGLIGEGSDAIAVAGDGTILRGQPTGHLQDLPQLPLSEAPKADRLGGPALEQAELLGAAPPALLRYVDHTFNGPNGVGVTLDGGVELGFADATHAAQKWEAAAAVLSDPDLGPLDYVDLAVPGRPAVGGVGHSPPPISGD
jgi:cell division septal protein FtsQ